MIVAFYSTSSLAGKDSCADFAAEYCRRNGVRNARDAFAWDGKTVCADALGIEGTREEKIAAIDELKIHGRVIRSVEKITSSASWGVTGREFIIGLLGSPGVGNGIRGLDEGFWTRQVVRRDIELGLDGYTFLSDMRFLEEGKTVKDAGGVIIEVIRQGAPTFNEQRFPAEWIDLEIVNDGTLDDLRNRVENHVEWIVNQP